MPWAIPPAAGAGPVDPRTCSFGFTVSTLGFRPLPEASISCKTSCEPKRADFGSVVANRCQWRRHESRREYIVKADDAEIAGNRYAVLPHGVNEERSFEIAVANYGGWAIVAANQDVDRVFFRRLQTFLRA